MSLLAAMGICSGCAASDIPSITPAEFREAVASDATAVVLDVRTPEEYDAGHLRDAVNLDYLNSGAFRNGIDELSPEHTYYVYCRSGRRSLSAAELMQKKGLNVVDMSGGILRWEQEGLPTVK